ncbi:MAG TPA: tetratricopeptide repeat protein [Terriglobia bacterium]|nr:tetratricopeptide repeat protein [Terriglobia bacterium]
MAASKNLPPRRRYRTWLALAALAVTALGGCRHAASPEAASAHPRDANVLLITLDTTRADHLSCYRDASTLRGAQPGVASGAQTPHLDALAAHGVRFVHATAQVPLTLPSHACIMTGAYPTVHGLRDMGGFTLAASHPTIASIMLAARFETAAFVGSRVLARHFGISNGFETYDDDMGGDTEEGKLPGVFPERRASVVTDRALAWLSQHANQTFFLWAHYYDPHAPYDPPEPYKRIYAQDLYSGEIAYMDEQVGRLLDALDQHGLASRTLVVVIGDHGESLGEHGEMTHGIFLYDATTHVPLIMAGPGIPAGKVIAEQVRSIDVMPTVLDFLKLPVGREAQGVSLWPLIEQGRKVRSNYAYLETIYPRTYMGWSELRGMRTDTWKLIIAPHPELYNLERDPGETTNLITRYPADSDELQKQIWEVAGTGAKHETLATSPVDAQTRQELASLGYVSAGTPREIQLGSDAPDPKDRVDVLKILSEVEHRINARAYPEAVQLMQRGLALDPANPMGHIYLAMAYERMGDYARAVAVYQDALRKNLATDQVYSRLGKDELRLHQLDAAVDAMMHANQLNPTDLDNLRNLGTAELEFQRVDEAERAFKAITVQNDRYAAAWNGLGLVAIQRGDASTARQDLERAIAVGPDEVEPLLNLGVLYQKTGNKEQALRYLTLFLEKAPRDQYGKMFPDVRAAIQELRGGG